MTKKNPIGVSEWRKYGKKYKYYNYFEKQIRKDERKRVLKKIEKIMSSYSFNMRYLDKFYKLLKDSD